MEKRRILVVEDERPILDGLVDVFTFHGYEVDGVSDGAVALEYALTRSYDLIVLDVMLPSLDGFSVCNELRERNRTTPVIMLTARTSEEDLVNGLKIGADDYIAKPFSIRELVVRVEALLRRSYGDSSRERFIELSPDIVIDCLNLTGSAVGDRVVSEDALSYTRREVELLRYLLKHHDRPVPRGELLSAIWGYARGSEIETRTVDIHIAKLRKKIERDPKDPEHLVTVRGEGYKLHRAAFRNRR
jgi:DNA-binding response OmpR family regulator